MNIKLHTPKSLKKGSGMSSFKQFLLSLLATTVSIALTFGTAAIIDHNKNKKANLILLLMMMKNLKKIEILGKIKESNLVEKYELLINILKNDVKEDYN